MANYTAISAGLLFLSLRIAGLLKANELEDQDSIGFLERAEIFRVFDFGAILDMEATALPVYSMATAFFALATGDLELAARLVSLVSSTAAAGAMYLLARKLAGQWAGIAALAVMAVNPYLIRFSYSIVSEPLYTALFAWTLYLFVRQLRAPTVRGSLCLGLLAGVAFGTRFESILLFTALPLVQLVFLRFTPGASGRAYLVKAALVYFCTFAVLLAPQIWRVSEKMNTFALNGRTVWQSVLNEPDGKSYREKLYGLDHDPAVLNIRFLQEHPEVLEEVTQDRSAISTIVRYGTKMIFNLEELHSNQVSRLVGLPAFVFSVIGFLALLRSAHGAEAFATLTIIGIGLVAPLTNRVNLDHIALIAAPLAMLAGIGLVETFRSLQHFAARSSLRRFLLAAVLLGVAVAPYKLDLYRLYTKPDDANVAYDRAAIEGPVSYIKGIAANAGTRPVVIAAQSYVPYFAGAESGKVPWTDCAGLQHYMRANGVIWIYVDEELAEFPLFGTIGSPEWNAAFRLRYDGHGADGGLQRIYRLEP